MMQSTTWVYRKINIVSNTLDIKNNYTVYHSGDPGIRPRLGPAIVVHNGLENDKGRSTCIGMS